MSIVTKNLAGVGIKEAQEFLDSFDVVLSDCDGVLWNFVTEIKGAVESLKKLQDLGKRVYFVTNNSVATASQYCMKIRKLGLDATPEQIVNTAMVVTWYLKKINFQGEILPIASKSFRQTLTNAGFVETAPIPPVSESNVAATLEGVQDRKSIKAIIVDVDMHCCWSKMALAISCLKREECLFLCGAMDEWVTYDSTQRILGPGPLTGVIATQSERKPTVFGKPSEILRDYIFQELKIPDPKRCLFIGDTVNQDMRFGSLCGFQKLFVNTGCDRLEDTEKFVETKPNYYIPSLGDLNPLIDSVKNSVNNI